MTTETTETTMVELPWPVRLAEGCATDTSLAHAVAIGLLEVVDRFRFADPGHPIPAPGTADLPDEIQRHALDAVHATASAHILVGEPEPDDRALDRVVARAQAADLAAQRGLRHLAQIGLGVAQHSHDGDDVELVERTMIGVLVHDVAGVTAVDDAFPLVGGTREEVSVELAGAIARMICDEPHAEPHEPPIGFAVAGDGIDPITVAITPGGGVTVDGDHHDAPVTITEVTASIIGRITAADPTAIGRLRLDWGAP